MGWRRGIDADGAGYVEEATGGAAEIEGTVRGREVFLVGAPGDEEMSAGGEVARVGVVLDVIRMDDAIFVGDDDGSVEHVEAGLIQLGVGFDGWRVR